MATQKKDAQEIAAWIVKLSTHDFRPVVKKLLGFGEPALVRLVEAIDGTRPVEWSREMDYRDLADNQMVALSALGEKYPDRLVTLMSSKRRLEISTLVWSVGQMKTTKVAPVLIQALSSKNQTCRWAAATGLKERGNASAVPALIKCLRDRASNVRSASIAALARHGDERAVKPLSVALAAASNQRYPGIVSSIEAALKKARSRAAR
jgi:HEAT repeat protein